MLVSAEIVDCGGGGIFRMASGGDELIPASAEQRGGFLSDDRIRADEGDGSRHAESSWQMMMRQERRKK